MKHLTLILFIIPSFIFGQGWEKTYGGEYGDVGSSVQQTTDGGYIITGETEPFEIGEKELYLFKTDSMGNALWYKTYGGENDDWGYSVQQTIDGGYIIVGKTYLLGTVDVYLIKTDSNGDSLWSRIYGGAGNEYGSSVQQTTDGGYVLIGFTSSFGNGANDFYLIKTDENGDSLWTKTYGGEGFDYGKSIQQTTDGGYIFTGEINLFENGYYDVYLVKTDENGDSLWTKTFGGEYGDVGRSVQQTTDGGYIIAGKTYLVEDENIDVYLIKTDSIGNSLWYKTIGSENNDWGDAVQQTTDGGYIIVGGTSSSLPTAYSDVYLIKTDGNGDTLWTRTFGGENYDTGLSVQQTTDGGYIITGITSSFGHGYSDVYLIKTDENGIITFTTEIPIPNPNRKLLKIVDLSGSEISEPQRNVLYIEIYDDGTTLKKMIIK